MNLKDYLEENGIKKTWFAQKIGCKATYLIGFLAGRNTMAVKYWENIVKITKNHVTFDDIIRTHTEYEVKVSTKKFKTQKECMEAQIKKSRGGNDSSKLPPREKTE